MKNFRDSGILLGTAERSLTDDAVFETVCIDVLKAFFYRMRRMTLNTCSDHESIHFYHAVHRLSTFWIMKQSEIHMRFRICLFQLPLQYVM